MKRVRAAEGERWAPRAPARRWPPARPASAPARVRARVHESLGDSLPDLQFELVEADELAVRNPFDTNVLAHRRDAAEARWDETLAMAADWDLAIRLAAQRPLLGVPVRAVLYSTSVPGRLSDLTDGSEQAELRRS